MHPMTQYKSQRKGKPKTTKKKAAGGGGKTRKKMRTEREDLPSLVQ